MNDLGYIRVCAASPEVKVADIEFNISKISQILEDLDKQDVDITVFPELSLTGYTCGDLFYQSNLISECDEAIKHLAHFSSSIQGIFIIGAPVRIGNRLYNCAVVFHDGRILGIIPKSHLPNYNEFYEKRWFATPDENIPETIPNSEIPFGKDIVFSYNGTRFGIELCEDLWAPVPPSCNLCQAGAEIIFNLSASNEQAGKHSYLLDLIRQQSARCRCGYVYSSAGLGESSTDLVFSGNCIIAENGALLGESERFVLSSKFLIKDIDVEILRNDRRKFSTFSEGIESSQFRTINELTETKMTGPAFRPMRHIDPHPFVYENETKLKERITEISNIQAWGLAQRLRAINCRKAVVGISGGLDSTLALLVTVRAFDMLGLDRKGVIGVTMPGFGTTGRTHNNASVLMEQLGITSMEIPIGDSVMLHFKEIGQDPAKHDATYENSQARERTQILMDLANEYGGIVIGTGDLSELALGWCTYNGDQMSMYSVNASVPKTLVKYLVGGYAHLDKNEKIRETLLDIIDTPISPELLPANADDSIEQKTEDLVGPYELHDFFIHGMLRNSYSPRKIYFLACIAFEGKYSNETIKHWLGVFYRRFFSQQFKRSCMPDGVKVGSVCLSPRGDWRMPSDASSRLWLEEVSNL